MKRASLRSYAVGIEHRESPVHRGDQVLKTVNGMSRIDAITSGLAWGRHSYWNPVRVSQVTGSNFLLILLAVR